MRQTNNHNKNIKETIIHLKYILFFIGISLCGQMMAQGKVTTFIKKVGTKIDSMSVKGLDRNYIDAPERPWQVIVRGNVMQTIVSMNTHGNIVGQEYSAKPTLKTTPSQYIGLWAGYRGYGVGYTVNVGGDKGSYLTFGATGGAYGINVRIHSFDNSNPSFNLNSDLWQGSAGVGYAYNWVPARGLLINVMAMPMLTFVNKLKAYGYGTNIEELMEDPMFWNRDISYDEWDKWYYANVHVTPMGDETFNSGLSIGFDARMSLTYNVGNLFFSAYGQFNNIRYHHNNTKGYLDDWFINTSVGIRL